jgi:hypothetical protein
MRFVPVTSRAARGNDDGMAKKRSSRAKTTRSKSKARSSAKTKKANRPARAAKKAAPKRRTVAKRTTSAKVVWPGLPPGYFERGR